MAAPVIETHSLEKAFGPTLVLEGVELRLSPGHAALVIGANGTGKSTLLRIFAGLTAPSSGTALIFGQDSRRLSARYRRRIGMMSHQSFLYPNLTAAENLEFHARLYGLAGSGELTRRWLQRVGLAEAADDRVRSFSRGMEQRLSAARAMITGPALLLLDEPFSGLDPQGAATVSSLAGEAVARGAAVLIAAHAPLEIEGVDLELLELSGHRIRPYSGEVRRRRLRSLLGR